MSLKLDKTNWFSSQNLSIVLLGILLLINAIGLWQSIVIVDSSLYAIISKTMVVNANYWEIFVDGKDWLDKPHLPFWMGALSMKIFGFTTFAYKLPAFVFFLISLVFMFKIALKLYSKEVAWLSVVIVSSALHIVMSNNDVRAEPYLMGMVMGASYHLLMMTDKEVRWKHVFWAGIFIAMGVMTKGVFVIVPLGAAVFFYLLLGKNLRKLLQVQWLALLILVVLLILPEVYAVYIQFDMHPEKLVFDKQNVSGVKFFLWDSQFGRFFNSGPIKGSGDPFFFIHTMLWAFAPWSIYGFVVLFRYVKNLFTKQRKLEYFNFFGFTLLFVVFSMSKFQLPHYTNMIFPFLAIIVANEIVLDSKKINLKWLVLLPMLLLVLGIIAIPLLIGEGFVISLVCLIISISYFVWIKLNVAYYFSILAPIIGVSLFLNLVFYPFLYSYQGKTQAAYFINNSEDIKTVYAQHSYDFEFHLQKEMVVIDGLDNLKINDVLFVDSSTLKKVENSFEVDTIQTFADYHVTSLTLTFLNVETRDQVVDSLYLVRLH